MQYFDYLQDTYNIHETFVKVPQSHYIHNKVVKLFCHKIDKKKFTQLFSKLETVLHQLDVCKSVIEAKHTFDLLRFAFDCVTRTLKYWGRP